MQPELTGLKARAFELAGEAMLITDSRNEIIAVNAAFTALTGYEPEEVIGHNPRFLASRDTPAETFAAMWAALEAEGHWAGEVWNRRKDGSIYPERVNIHVSRNAAGEVAHYFASFADASDLKAVDERLEFLTNHDPLTGLPNRASCEIGLVAAIQAGARSNTQVAVVLIDLDNFKQINDSLGHAVGDKLLVSTARRLRDLVRASDQIYRLSGDEFLVLLHDIEDVMAVSAIASKVLRGFLRPHFLDSGTLYSSPSIGISIFPMDGNNAEQLIKHAEAAMYHAKNNGRSRFEFFAPQMNTAAHERFRLETALHSALEQTTLQNAPQFELYFQPQLEVATGRVTGIEALARWTHPELGSIPPVTFIKLAEETGLIQPLGDWVFWEACRKLQAFKRQGVSGVRVAVNLSTQQLRSESFPSVVRGALACYELEPSELELEITESTAMQNPTVTIAILEQLDDMGITLAIDDFGTGYSSLSYLKHLPIHRLKLDRSFVRDLDIDQNDAAICAATISLGHNLGLEMVAEGVETESQRDFLNRLDCDVLQGFLYSKPLPADQVVPFVLKINGAQPDRA